MMKIITDIKIYNIKLRYVEESPLFGIGTRWEYLPWNWVEFASPRERLYYILSIIFY